MATALLRLCEELQQSDTRETLLRTLDALQELLANESAEVALTNESIAVVMRLLLERLGGESGVSDRDQDGTNDDDTEHATEPSGVECCLDMQINAKISSMILRDLLKSRHRAAWMAEHTALLDFVLRALQPQSDGTLHRSYGEALQCVKTLAQRGVQLFSMRSEVVLAVANSISEDVKIDTAMLLVQVLLWLSSESAECADEIARVVATRSSNVRKETLLLFLRCVLDQRDSWSHLHTPIHCQVEQEWDLLDRLRAVVKVLKFGTSFEKLITIEALRLKTEATARHFVSEGVVSELIKLKSSLPSLLLVRERSAELLSAITKSDMGWLGELIDCQLRHPDVDFLTPEFCSTDIEQPDWFSFTGCMRQLRSGNEAEIARALDDLPRNIYILAFLCLDHGLMTILLELVATNHRVSDGIKDVAWRLLLEMNYELPTIGATPTNSNQQLIPVALQFLRAEYPLERRQQAALLLLSLQVRSATACELLVNSEGGISVLVSLLAEENDGEFAGTLCDLVRELSTEDQDYSAEIDLVVRGILENRDYVQCVGVRYQNLLSVYRKPSGVTLGREGEDSIVNLTRNVEILSSGNETEKLIVLKQIRTLATSWSQEHLDVLSKHILEIVPVLICETAELKQLTVEILRILAALDDECRKKVLVAGRIYGKDNPEVFDEFLDFDRMEERVKRAKLSSSSDCEREDTNNDNDDDWERSWVTIDHAATPDSQ